MAGAPKKKARTAEVEAASRATAGSVSTPAPARAAVDTTESASLEAVDPTESASLAKSQAGSVSTPAPAAPPVPVAECTIASASTPAPAAPPRPDLPSAEHKDTDTLQLMRAIVKHVKYRLRAFLKESRPATAGFPDVELHEHPPLPIKKAANSDELLSYKEAWNSETASVSFDGTRRYEAGGNIFWLHPFCASGGDEAKAAGETPSWAQVHEMAAPFRRSGGNEDVELNVVKEGSVAKEKRICSKSRFMSMLRRWTLSRGRLSRGPWSW